MALPLTKPVILPLAEERRRHQRVKVNLLGRYMLADRREFPCQVIDMSPGGMALIAPIAGQPGERVIAYVDHLGRLEGKIARVLENGFAMTIAATLRKRDKLAAQLTWLANRQILNLPEDRRHDRFAPRNATAAIGPAERHQCRLPRDRPFAVGRRDRNLAGSAASGRRRRDQSGKPRAASCATSKMASPSNSCACSTRISSKTTSPANNATAP